MSILESFDTYCVLNENDLDKWRATLAGIETEIAHHTDIRDKAKREAGKRLRQDAVSDVLWAARWMFDDVISLLERRRNHAAREIARLEAEGLAQSMVAARDAA